MIVEDEPAVRDLMVTLIKMQNCDPYAAVDSEQAMQVVESNKIDLALIDIGLPGEDGISLSIRINSLDSRIKIILMSAVDIDNMGHEYQLPKATDFIRKPFHLQTMIDKIRLAGCAA